jgi:hypothetical protein
VVQDLACQNFNTHSTSPGSSSLILVWNRQFRV